MTHLVATIPKSCLTFPLLSRTVRAAERTRRSYARLTVSGTSALSQTSAIRGREDSYAGQHDVGCTSRTHVQERHQSSNGASDNLSLTTSSQAVFGFESIRRMLPPSEGGGDDKEEMGAKVTVLALALEADTEESFSPANAVVCDVILILPCCHSHV